MVLLKSAYLLFFFFTHKQIYAGRHFTGANVKVGSTLSAVGFINLLIGSAFLIYLATISSVVSSLTLLVVSIICLLVLNTCTSKIAMNQALKESSTNELLFRGIYEHKCNVISTIIALIGSIFNSAFAICCIIFVF